MKWLLGALIAFAVYEYVQFDPVAKVTIVAVENCLSNGSELFGCTTETVSLTLREQAIRQCIQESPPEAARACFERDIATHKAAR